MGTICHTAWLYKRILVNSYKTLHLNLSYTFKDMFLSYITQSIYQNTQFMGRFNRVRTKVFKLQKKIDFETIKTPYIIAQYYQISI